MANCSIPNSTPASGRISTRSLKRSKKQNNRTGLAFPVLDTRSRSIAAFLARAACLGVRRLDATFERRTSNSGHRPSKCQLHGEEHHNFGHWKLDVRRSTFSFFRRVKGAWWPSRSSKPSSSRKWRGRFDSYPLRHFISHLRFSSADWPSGISDNSNRKSQFGIKNRAKGGESHVA